MIIQCSDLERALRTPELMPDARAHAEHCEKCRRELYLWGEISRVGPQLHEEWESAALWTRIAGALAAEAPPKRKRTARWYWALAAAAAVAIIAGVTAWQVWRVSGPQSREFLTDDALREVQQAEAAYARSIDKLSAVAGPGLQKSPSGLAAAYREKLVLLDSEIAELKSNIDGNRYNTYLQLQLASLYREKQKTLQEWLENAKRN